MNKGHWIERHWLLLTLLFWVAFAAYLVSQKWTGLYAYWLGDTDDNLRLMQVRALLDGQGWWDLRQYRLAPPEGANIHWSRLPDLPIAGLILLLSPLGERVAESWAIVLAPTLPLLVVMIAMAVTARRLLSPRAFWLILAILACAGSTGSMFAPFRIDHHNWQLAMVAVAVMGMADPKRVRGGLTVGIATALSLSIGLEMLLYLGVLGAGIVLFWVANRQEGERLGAYALSLGGGAALGYLLFASYDNGAIVCDALSPVWLSVALVAGAAMLLLSRLPLRSAWLRFGAAVVAGLGIAAFYALVWPECLGRLERVPPELDDLWLSNVREAMPVYRHGFQTTVEIVALPVIGLVGTLLMLWQTRRDARFGRWAAIGTAALIAGLLLLWQTRAAAAAQLLALPGAAGLAWSVIVWVLGLRQTWLRLSIEGAALAIAVAAYLTPWSAIFPGDGPPDAYRQSINTANSRCPSIAGLTPVGREPAGTVLTFVDLGPRLITLTHHNAIAGPYHRNSDAILDVMRAFRGDAANARAIMARRHVNYLLICPNMSESTIYRAEAPDGFYSRLVRGEVPDWLEPVDLGVADTPFRMWRVSN